MSECCELEIKNLDQAIIVFDENDIVEVYDVGVRGEKGEQGIQGIQGVQGIQGEQGIQGIQGDKGDKGDRGDDGQDFEKPINPVFSYTSGKLTRIDYDGGAYKVFTYNLSGVLTQIEFFFNGVTKMKTFNYTSGILTSIDEVTI